MTVADHTQKEADGEREEKIVSSAVLWQGQVSHANQIQLDEKETLSLTAIQAWIKGHIYEAFISH